MSCKGESEPSIQCYLGRKIELVQRFTTIHNVGHNWWRTDGIRVEYFPGFTTLQLVQEVQKFMNKMSDPAHQRRIIFMSMFNDITWRMKDNEQECIANATLVCICKKISSKTLVIPRAWIRKELVFYLQRKTTRRMTQSRGIDDEEAQGTSGKPSTTRSIDKNLYWCRIPENSWSRTMHHDKTYWRDLTICRASDMSWENVTTRWQIDWPERLDSREHQNRTRIGSYNFFLQGKYGVEIRIESVNKDNSHLWVKISHGLNKLVTDLINREYDDNEQEISETKTEVFAFASRSKAEAKPRRPTSGCSSTRTVPFRKRIWIDIEPRAQSNQAYPVTKK